MKKHATKSSPSADEFRSLGFSTRTINALADRNISTLKDLTALNEFDLLVIPGIGEKALQLLKPFAKAAPKAPLNDRYRAVSTAFKPETLSRIDAWAAEHESPTRSDAVRNLVEIGLQVGFRPGEA